MIAKEAPRSTRLAAAELRDTIEKITGARLTIRTSPDPQLPNRIYVGESDSLRQKGITADGLPHGAYRIVSGDRWLALLGDDTDFQPIEPWAKNNSDRQRLQQRWQQASGLPYGVPNGGMYKNRRPMPEELAKFNREMFWGFDERGSYNAVCGFLRQLGVRWYLPGELGEVIPKTLSIPLPKIDETVRPDFALRQFNVRFGNSDEEIVRWAMRLGIRQVNGLMIAHGMHTMTQPAELKKEKPDWFALYGGKRDTKLNERLNHLCYSNPELFAETVKWARAQFDIYDFQSVSIMPPDAYISICQCERCKGQQVDEMGSRGKLSNHVWDFVNRVAKEVAKTHPDKLILCCAYGANTLPPTNLDKLQPNVQVMIVGGRRPRNSLPDQRKEIQALRAGWLEKTDRPIMVFENYPFTARGTYLPAFVPKTIGESINATKGLSAGEDIWLSFPRWHDDANIGFDHFQIYFTARMWWGGKNQNVDSLLAEYCDRFYGPAAPSMRAFFEFCEQHYQAMETDLQSVQTALTLFASAKSQVEVDSIHAKRLALIDHFLERLRSKAAQLAQGRGPVAKLRTVWDPKEPIVIDGKLDDQYWTDCPTSSVGRLRELQTGRQPVFGTTVKAGWDRSGQNLYFAVRCEERPGEALNIATTQSEDQSIWYGDCIEIEIATDSHHYYQIAVNPAGALIDLDRQADKSAWFRWQSQAEVATQIAEDHWIAEIRIPVTEDENDPLNQVVGHKPSQSLPWYFNLCRQRIRDNGSEFSAFSPTGTASFHEPLKFAHFYDGRSHSFPVDETVTDFLIESARADKLKRDRKYEQASALFTDLANTPSVTDLQKSRALAEAATCARLSGDELRAMKLIKQIPLEPVAKIAAMESFTEKRDWNQIIEAFGDEDLNTWPFTEIGAAASLRGRAFANAKMGRRAETDLALALEFTPDLRKRMSLLNALAKNRESNLHNDDQALIAYQEICRSSTNTRSSDYYYGIQGAARILTKHRRFDEALKTLGLVDDDKLTGTWSSSMQLARAQTLQAAGRTDEAVVVYRTVLSDRSAPDRVKSAARQAIESIENP